MRRLVFLHGFTQTHHHWHDVAHRLATEDDATTLAFVDLPGHGTSTAEVDGGIDTIGQRLVDLAGSGTWIGYSMGGRVGLVAAATGDPRIERLVLLGATPGIVDDGERAERARLDDARADRIEQSGVDAFLEEWLSMPMFARLPSDPDALAARRSNTAAGLAHSLRRHGTGAQRPLWDRLPTLRLPVLVLAGELDDKFVEIGLEMADLLPEAEFVAVPDAGHAAHIEAPGFVASAIDAWLRSVSD